MKGLDLILGLAWREATTIVRADYLHSKYWETGENTTDTVQGKDGGGWERRDWDGHALEVEQNDLLVGWRKDGERRGIVFFLAPLIQQTCSEA